MSPKGIAEDHDAQRQRNDAGDQYPARSRNRSQRTGQKDFYHADDQEQHGHEQGQRDHAGKG